ncbi:alpha/beta hydrolase [Prauserella marina]|nr:alpha/beta fold hydrolase [Prauserella marina]ASR39649.1 alpha/beta hydrolase [Prauserella marina]
MAELPLVLLHAYPVDARMWNPVRARLAARTRLITPDQRGLGRTPLPETERAPSLDDAAKDVIALLDKLELDKVVLGGCSMGGYLTLAVLRAAPERVGAMVFIDSKATADAEEARLNRLAAAERAEREGTDWLADALLPGLLGERTRRERPDVVETVRELIESQRPEGVAWAQRAMAARPDSSRALTEAKVPTLVVVGEEDTLTPPAAAEELSRAAGGETTLVVVPGAGHLTPLEAPERVAAAVLDWLRGTTIEAVS